MAVVDRRRSAPRSASGSPACTRASASSASRARRAGSSCTPATTTPSVQFYQDVFRWDTHVGGDTPDFRYTTLGEGDDQLAGIMDAPAFLPEGVPAHWSVYFGVDDADAALAKVVELGGSIVRPPRTRRTGASRRRPTPPARSFKLVAGG